MFAGIKHHVRYWGFLALKFAAAAFVSAIGLWFLHWAMGEFTFGDALLYTTLFGVWFQFSFGLFYLAIRDQRYRCRTCLRKLRMPIETGSWGYMLQLGRPQIEYICPYGHGKLNVEEVQITGTVSPAWTDQGDIWDELFAVKEDQESDR